MADEPEELEDEDFIPVASALQIRYCTDCGDPHIVFVDEEGEPFAEAILGGEPLAQFIGALQRAVEMASNVRH